MVARGERGRCRECGADLIDWDRVHALDPEDVQHTFASLRKEMFRHYFWHVPLDRRAANYALRRGVSGTREAARARLRRSVGPARPYRDGYQTPREGSGNPIHYAQHATATCCRRCIEVWHGIPRGQALGEDMVLYLAELVVLYIGERVPELTEGGQYVAPLR
jgi:hypothetical protein